MTASEVARVFKARREGKNFRAKCPVHKSRGLTLGIYPGISRVMVYCFAGCTLKDILDTVGLTWRDTLYRNDWLSPEEFKAKMKQQRAIEQRIRDNRIGEWIIRFADQGYTLDDRQRDVASATAAAMILSGKITPHWQRILDIHMERIAAADHCRMRGMLPNAN